MEKKDISWLLDKPIAHRGFHCDGVPENTEGAIVSAISKGYNIEIDIMLTQDNKIIVFHDENLNRMIGINKEVKETSYKELKEYEIKGTKSKIPLLKDILKIVDGKVGLLIEIKSRAIDGIFEELLVKELASYSGKVAIQSFNSQSVNYLIREYPDLIVGQLSGSLSDEKDLGFFDKFLLRNLIGNLLIVPDFIGYEHSELKGFPLIYKRIYNIPFLAWTVRDRNFHRKHFDNIIFEGFNIKNQK